MKQSRATSLLKSTISTVVGFGVSFVAQLVFLPMLGVAIELSQNTAFALIMTVISIARGYIMERVFEFFRMTTRLSPAAIAILAERQRQVDAEGFSAADDDQLQPGELALAGGCYALRAGTQEWPPHEWPWSNDWWKPTDFRRDLIKAGALVLAELEKLYRNRRKVPAIPLTVQAEQECQQTKGGSSA